MDRNNEWHGKVQMFWGIDKPIVFNHGRSVIFAFSKLGQYIQGKGEGWFFRSDNILTEADPAKIKWQMLPDGEQGVRNPAFHRCRKSITSSNSTPATCSASTGP